MVLGDALKEQVGNDGQLPQLRTTPDKFLLCKFSFELNNSNKKKKKSGSPRRQKARKNEWWTGIYMLQIVTPVPVS